MAKRKQNNDKFLRNATEEKEEEKREYDRV